MVLVKVASVAEFKEAEPVIVEFGNLSIGVYRYNSKYYAYRNWCPHQGGPACEGKVRNVVEHELEEGVVKTMTRKKIFCPWHGVAYDITTGAHRTNKKLRLLSFKVVVDKENVLIDAPRSGME